MLPPQGYCGSMKIKAKTDTWLLGALDAIEQRGKSSGVLVRSCAESLILAVRILKVGHYVTGTGGSMDRT